MILSSQVRESAEIDIIATVEAHSSIAGEDSVASLPDISNVTILKVFKVGRFVLSKVGDVKVDKEPVEYFGLPRQHMAKYPASCLSMTGYTVKMWR